MKKYLLIIPFLFLLISGFSQIDQVSSVQSSGGSFSESGNLRSECIVGQTASSSGFYSANGYSGSIGFLTYEEGGMNTPPVAIAGDDALVVEGTVVFLDGTASFDPQDDQLFYFWKSLDGITLTDTSSAQPSFSVSDVLARRKYRFTLKVNDGVFDSAIDTVIVTVSDPGWIPNIYTNSSTLYAIVTLNEEVAEECDHVNALVNGECRGVAEVFFFGGQAYVTFNIQTEASEVVNFDVYDYSEDKICPADIEVTTIPGGDIGSPSDPILINGDCFVSTHDIEELVELKLIPNPTSGVLNVTAKFDKNTEGTLMVYTLTQQLVYSQNFRSDHLESSVDLSDLPNGTYIFVLKVNGFNVSRKIEKMR